MQRSNQGQILNIAKNRTEIGFEHPERIRVSQKHVLFQLHWSGGFCGKMVTDDDAGPRTSRPNVA